MVHVLLYVPNIIGYVRLALLVVSWCAYYSHPWLSILTYLISAGMDALDGFVARKLNQTSAFGAWLDVVVDVLGRGMLWCRIYNIGYLVAALEWLTFVCTHTAGEQWKSSFTQEPFFVKAVMANNFKTPLGVTAIGGLHCLPVWLYCHYHGLLYQLGLPVALQYLGIGVLAGGRALCSAVEVWCIWAHIICMCERDATTTKLPSNAASASK